MQPNCLFLPLFLGTVTTGAVHPSFSLREWEHTIAIPSGLDLLHRRLGFQSVHLLSGGLVGKTRRSTCPTMAADGGKVTGKGFGKPSTTTKTRPSTGTKSRQSETKKPESDDYYDLVNDALSKKESKGAGKKSTKSKLSDEPAQISAKEPVQAASDVRPADPVQKPAKAKPELNPPAPSSPQKPAAAPAAAVQPAGLSAKAFQKGLKLEAAEDRRQAIAAEQLQLQLRAEAAADRARAAAAAEMHLQLRRQRDARAPPRDPAAGFNELFAASKAGAEAAKA